jgi:amino acid transporter
MSRKIRFFAQFAVLLTRFENAPLLERYQNFQDPFKDSKYSAGSLVSAFFAGLLAFDGWDVLNMGTEEIKNPRKYVLKCDTYIICLETCL